jgi:hypothetical protein
MAQAITAFCIGERYALRNRLYDRDKTWRTGNFKNRISGNEHGDLFVGQMETSAKTKTTTENTLFGKITTTNFEPYKEAERKGFCEYQDWSGYLLSLLKFAEAIGKRNLPEIINWKEILKARGGGTGTATTESMFGSNTAKSDAEIYLNFSIVQKNIIPQTLPLGIPYYHQGTTLPFMDDNRLLYLRENKEGEIVLNNLGALSKNKKYSIVVEYTPEDLPPALEATYIHFARDRMLMHEIMKQFNNEKEE